MKRRVIPQRGHPYSSTVYVRTLMRAPRPIDSAATGLNHLEINRETMLGTGDDEGKTLVRNYSVEEHRRTVFNDG